MKDEGTAKPQDDDNVRSFTHVKPQGEGKNQGDNLSLLTNPDREFVVSLGKGQKGTLIRDVTRMTKLELASSFMEFRFVSDKARNGWIISGEVDTWTAEEVVTWNEGRRKAAERRQREDQRRVAEGKAPKGELKWTPRTAGQRYRDQRHVQSVSILFKDLDHFDQPLSELIALVRRSGFEAVIYTTHSHGRPGVGHRYRVVFFLEEPWRREWGKPALVDAHKALDRLIAFSELSDETGFTPDRIAYRPAYPKETEKLRACAFIAGREVRWSDLIELPSDIDVWSLVMNELPDLIARETSVDKIELNCPNAAQHSDGRTEGCFLSREYVEKGIIRCQHAHCANLDEHAFLKLLVSQKRLTREQIEKYSVSRPRVQIGIPQMAVLCDRMVRELTATKCFFRMGQMVLYFAPGRNQPEEVKAGTLQRLINRHIDLFKISERDEERNEVAARLTKDERAEIMGALLADLPEIKTYLLAPVPGFEHRGYYPDHGIYSLVDESIDLTMTPKDGLAYLRKNVLPGYVFIDGAAGEASAIALMCSIVAGPTLSIRPNWQVTGAGSDIGKTMLPSFPIEAILGQLASVVAYSKVRDVERLLISTTRSGEFYLLIDNVPRGTRFDDDTMSAATTSGGLKSTAMYAQLLTSVLPRFTMILTGNNIDRKEDSRHRFMMVRLDKPQENMRQYGKWLHAEPHEFAIRERKQILAAIYALLKAPRVASSVPSRFPEWDKAIRWPLLGLGLFDFYINQGEVDAEGEEDHLRQTWIGWLHGVMKGEKKTATELHTELMGTKGEAIKDTLLDLLEYRPVEGHRAITEWSQLQSKTVFGKVLQLFVNEPIGNMTLRYRIAMGVRSYLVEVSGKPKTTREPKPESARETPETPQNAESEVPKLERKGPPNKRRPT